MPYVATNFKDDLYVQHGPCWHIEKPGTAGEPCYTIIGSIVLKDLATAKQLFELHKGVA
jgi:hypothetical protein